MEDLKDLEPQDEKTPEDLADYELNHTDKLVGVFSEPASTFTRMSAHEPKTTDWFIPVLIVIAVAIISNILMMSNPAIKFSIIENQMDRIEQNLQDMVDSGNLTRAQADQQLEQIRDRMENQMGAGMILQVIGIIVVTFILFFIVSGVFFLVAKFGIKGEAGYKAAMVAYGLPYYILVIQIIVMVILALAMNKAFQSTSVAAFLDMDTTNFTGYILNKLDVFSIWFYVVVGIGFAKMFKSENTGKYIGMTFGIWLGFSILIFFLAQAIPFLRFFIR